MYPVTAMYGSSYILATKEAILKEMLPFKLRFNASF